MIEIIKTFEDFLSLKEDWDNLSLRTSPMLEFDWFYICAKHSCNEEDLYIISYKENDEIKCIIPLIKTTRHKLPAYELIGATFLYEPSSVICQDKKYLSIALRELNGLKHSIFLNEMPADFENYTYPTFTYFKDIQSYASLEISGDWDALYSGLKSSRRTMHRRKLKKLNAIGEVSTEFLTPNPKEFESLFEKAMEIESQGWKGRDKTALLFDQKRQDFFREYLLLKTQKRNVQISFLSVDGQKIAMEIGVIYDNCYWVLKMGYNEEFNQCSPGLLNTMEVVKYAFECNYSTYEFLGVYEKWQDMWPITLRNQKLIVMHPLSLTGIPQLAIKKISDLKNKLKPAQASH